jgi:transposase-like protein
MAIAPARLTGIVPINAPGKTVAELRCPHCGATTSWLLKDGRRRCARCRRDWRPGRLPLRLSLRQWREVLRWFVRDTSSAEIARETGLERKRVVRALLIVRMAVHRSEHPGAHRAASPRPSDASLIGLRVSNGRAFAEIVPPPEAEPLERWVRRRASAERMSRRGTAAANEWKGRYMAVVYHGRLYRLTASGAERVPFGPVEAFWAYVQRRLRAKGGIRRERRDLYLASFAWRYNHRQLSRGAQIRELLSLIQRYEVARVGLSRVRRLK